MSEVCPTLRPMNAKRPTKKLYATGVAHPATFSQCILLTAAALLEPEHVRVLDPFAGVGKIHELRTMVDWDLVTVGVELEPEWASLHPDTLVGNALTLPFADESFDAVVTSPTYGNRLADHHNAQDASTRRSYTHDLGRILSEGNSGSMQWGPAYRDFHEAAWLEVKRVLRPEGRLILNISDHIRRRKRQYVASWHTATLIGLGFEIVDAARVQTSRLRVGANSHARVRSELVLAFDKVN